MDRGGVTAHRIAPNLVWVGGRYGICRDCLKRGTRGCKPECQPPDFKLFKPWYGR